MDKEEVWIPPVSLISALCRICVTPTDVDCSIYDTGQQEDGMTSLHMMMQKLFPTIFNDQQVASDQAMNWPCKVCQDCLRSVTGAYGLYELCLKSTDRLKKLLTEEGNAISTDAVGMKVEQVYISDLVKTEFAESDAVEEQLASKSQESSQKILRSHRAHLSSKKRTTNSSQTISVKERKHKKDMVKDRQYQSSCDDEEDPSGFKHDGTDAEGTLDSKPSKKKRRLRQAKVSKTNALKEAQDGAENEHDQTDEPQSKIDLYRCQLCDGPTYASPSELTEHLRAVHPDQIRSCEQCPKVFMSEQAFQHHQYCHATKRSHFCTFCDKGFQTPGLLKSHIRMHTHRADYLCSLCGKEFNNKSNLRQHVRRHTGDKPWACSQCPGRFTTKGGLTSHQHTHTKVKAFSCDTCGSQFNKHYSLIKHQLIHTGTRPYSCEVCAMRFTSTYHVKRHMRTHTGEKPFKCTYCERSFAQSNDMVKHMRMHVGDNPYQCDRCDASYRLLSDLRNHYKEHYQPGEKVPGASSAEDDKGIRFTSTDILKLRYRKEMAQSSVDGYDGNADDRKMTIDATEFESAP
uniref:Uncharacterized protein n=1 Tax=Anopheles atroparvus TaxID=41427 RepID=A0A182IQK5_ANOAO